MLSVSNVECFSAFKKYNLADILTHSDVVCCVCVWGGAVNRGAHEKSADGAMSPPCGESYNIKLQHVCRVLCMNVENLIKLCLFGDSQVDI